MISKVQKQNTPQWDKVLDEMNPVIAKVRTCNGVTSGTLTISRTIAETVNSLTKVSKPAMRAVRAVKLAAYFSAPFLIFDIIQNSRTLASKKASRGEKLDAALLVTGGIGVLGDITGTVAEGLAAAGAVAQAAIAWTTPLVGVSTVVYTVATGVEIHGWVKSQKFVNKLNRSLPKKAGGKSIKDWTKAMQLIKTSSAKTLSQQFKVDGHRLKERVEEIWKQSTEKKDTVDVKKLDKAFRLLKNRLNTKILCHKLAVVAAVINLIGVGILLFTPLGWLGFPLVGVAVALSIGLVIHNIVATRKFKKALEL